MAVLNRDQILNSDDLTKEEVSVPEWGGEVFVRTLTGTEKDTFEEKIIGKNGGVNMKNIRALLASLTIVDEKGERLFEESDIKELGRKSGAALSRVFNVAQRLNKISDDDVEELAKN